MTRILASLLALGTTTHALAGDGAVYTDTYTDGIGLSVENVSGSPNVDERLFQVMNAPIQVHAEGDFGCPVGSTGHSMELIFGSVVENGGELMPFGAWDVSDAIDLEGQPFGSFSIDHELDLQASWDPDVDLIDWGFNAAQVVSGEYLSAAHNEADMVHWMQSDQAFVSGFTMNVVLWCDDGVELFHGLEQLPVDVDVLYHGDRGIQYQPIVTTPGDIDSGTPDPLGVDAPTTDPADEGRRGAETSRSMGPFLPPLVLGLIGVEPDEID